MPIDKTSNCKTCNGRMPKGKTFNGKTFKCKTAYRLVSVCQFISESMSKPFRGGCVVLLFVFISGQDVLQ